MVPSEASSDLEGHFFLIEISVPITPPPMIVDVQGFYLWFYKDATYGLDWKYPISQIDEYADELQRQDEVSDGLSM